MVEDSFFAEKLKDFTMAMKERSEKAEPFRISGKLKDLALSLKLAGSKCFLS